MSVASESAEKLVSIILDGTKVILRITGKAVENVAVALFAILKNKSKSAGKIRLSKMLKDNKEVKIFCIKRDELKIFANEAKRYGVVYCVIDKKNHKTIDNMVDIMVSVNDAPKVNRIAYRFKLTTTDKAKVESSVERENTKNIVDDKNEKEQLNEVEKVNDNMVDDIFSKPEVKEEIVPLQGQTIENHLSESSFTNKNEMEETIKVSERKSVRADLKEIAESQKAQEELGNNLIDINPIRLANQFQDEPIINNKGKREEKYE